MSAKSRLRRLALATGVSTLGLLAIGGTAMAASVAQTGTTLTYTGDATSETLEITQVNATDLLFDAGSIDLTETAADCTLVADGGDGGLDVECGVTTWTAITANGGNGGDTLDASDFDATVSITLNGEAGSDELYGGSGNDTLDLGAGGGYASGGDGNDTLVGGVDNDSLNGGAGNDSLVGGDSGDSLDGGTGADSIDGGPGTDMTEYDSRVAGVTVDLGTVAGDGEPGENDTNANVENVITGDGSDVIVGVAGTTFVSTQKGNDSVTLVGGMTEDAEVYVSDGDDTINLAATTPSDSTNDYVGAYLGKGNDTLIGGGARVNAYGSDGNDAMTGGTADDYLEGGVGADTLNGAGGDDTLDGGYLYTNNAPPVEDTYGKDEADSITGGDGFDTVSYSSRNVAVTVDLSVAGGDGEAGENDSVDAEAVNGSSKADTLVGNDASNTLWGGSGADTIDGKGGFDQLLGGNDADTINASSDSVADLVDCGKSFTDDSDPAKKGADADTANLDYLDILEGDADCETVNRAAGPKVMPKSGSTGADNLLGTIRADLLLGFDGNDTLRGLKGNDELFGGLGNDRLFGGLGNDELHGGPGNDQLKGDAGNDMLFGGAGRDRLDGGAGLDMLFARDGRRGDTVTCTKVNLRNRIQRKQRDIVVADRGDVIKNRAFCGRVAFL